MKTFFYSTALSVGLVGAAASVTAGPHGEHGGKYEGKRHVEHRLQVMQEKLDLTDEQQAEIAVIYSEYRQDRKGTRGQKSLSKGKGFPDVTDPDYSEQVAKLAKSRAQRMEQAIIRKGEIKAKVHEVLTPEQRETWQSLQRDHHKGAFSKRHQRGKSDKQ